MTLVTARHALPLLQAGQAQKEVYHNEALALLDLALYPSASGVGIDIPPSMPEEGQSWIVGGNPEAAWVEYEHHLAGWTSGGWRFMAPKPGMLVWSLPDQAWALWSGAAWTVGDVPASRLMVDGLPVVGARQPAIDRPTGGRSSTRKRAKPSTKSSARSSRMD
jgi:hypothetical protein